MAGEFDHLEQNFSLSKFLHIDISDDDCDDDGYSTPTETSPADTGETLEETGRAKKRSMSRQPADPGLGSHLAQEQGPQEREAQEQDLSARVVTGGSDSHKVESAQVEITENGKGDTAMTVDMNNTEKSHG